MKVGLVGLGAMGLPMGRRLLGAGHELYVVPHVHRAPAEELASAGARIADPGADLAGESGWALTSVANVPQVQEVLFGDNGLATSPGKGLLYIDVSTINPTAARDHHSRLSKLGIDALDAPVGGGPARASDGSLTIMVGGSKEAF